MGGRLVGHDVDLDAAAEQFGQHGRAVPCQADRERRPVALGRQAQPQRVVEVGRDDVHVPVLDPPGQPGRVDVDDERDAVVECHRERLRAAHPAAAAGHRERAGQRPAEPLGGDGGERLVGALEDALGADVDPRPGRHLPVHGQPGLLEAAELGPVGPVADQVRVGDQHPRRPLVGAQHADRLARLDQHGLVLAELGQRPHHRVERLPGPGRPAGPAVDDEVVGALGDLRVEVVHQHAERGLGLPRPCGQRGAARSADGAGAFHKKSNPFDRTDRGDSIATMPLLRWHANSRASSPALAHDPLLPSRSLWHPRRLQRPDATDHGAR